MRTTGLYDREEETLENYDSQLGHTSERTPGVYVRNEDHGNSDLDVLWSGVRQYHREDKTPILFIGIGALAGILSTTIFFFLFMNKPQVTAEENILTTPITQESDILQSETNVPTAEATTEEGATDALATEATTGEVVSGEVPAPPTGQVTEPIATTQQPVQTARSTRAAVNTSSNTYKVRNGDTLEIIAKRMYGSGTPEMIEKIQRANRMNNPHALQIDQELVIPPKSY